MTKQQLLNFYKKIEWNELLRKDFGEYSLEETKPHLDRIKKIFDDIFGYLSTENLSTNFLSIFENQLKIFEQFTRQITGDFKDITQREDWINRIKDKEIEIFKSLFPIYSYIQFVDPSKDKKLQKLLEISEQKIKKLNENLNKTENLLNEAQKKATQSEIIKYGNFFGQEASGNKRNAHINFWVMIGCIVLTLSLSVFFLREITFLKTEGANFWSNLFNTINTQNIIIKFVVLSLGGYLISHFSKVYSAEKHLYNLNIQRQNALNSHKQILDSIISTESENEKEIRNAILLELTRAIFESKDTGYLNGVQSPTSTSQIVEISKTLTK